MTPVEEFESLLKDVVNAKRLSASKVTTLTDLVMKNVENDTQLVSILFRTHKSLSSSTAKIWSLYVFDALSRAAKSHVVKNNISGDISTQPGNSATFLLKVGGLAESLFKDMIASGGSETKEKTRKIYDIWVKGNTFPTAVLSQLSEVLKNVEEVPITNPLPAAASRADTLTTAPTLAGQTPVQSAIDPQAALLALLTQAAASSSVISPPAQIISNGSQLDTSQIAVLQQLARTAASVPSFPQSLSFAANVNIQKFPSSDVNGSSRTIPEARSIVTNEQTYSRYRSFEPESRVSSHFDNRDSSRGRYRGGNFRGRGRGDKLGRNWDGGDFRQKDTRSPPRSRARNRSQSPVRNGDRWNTRFNSPSSGRPRDPSPPSTWTNDISVEAVNEPGKDEFGRDIRLEAQKSPADSSIQPPICPPPVLDPRKSPTDTSNGPHSTLDENPVTHLPSNKLPSTTNATLDSESRVPKLGLESFDPATFDYTSSTSWEALGKLWEVTHGSLPSQEELVQFVIYGASQQMASAFQTSDQSINQQVQSTSFRGRGRGRGIPGGRGGYGNSRFAVNGRSDESESCAIVLGGGEDEDNEVNLNSQQTPDFSAQQDQNSEARTGRMQKVEGTWVYVRDA